MAKIDAFFKLMFEQGASDLHLVAGQQPIIRLRGEMERIKYKVLENDELKVMLYEIYNDEKAFEAHQQTPHFKKYLAEAVPLLASRERHVYRRAES